MVFNNENNFLTEDEAFVYEQLENIIMTEAVDEGLFDEEIYSTTLKENASYYTGGGGKRNIIKFDKTTKLKLLTTKFAIGFAKAKKDAKAAKLAKINRTRRKLIDELTQKYNSPATKAAKDAIKVAMRDSNYLSTYASRNKNRLVSSKKASITQPQQIAQSKKN